MAQVDSNNPNDPNNPNPQGNNPPQNVNQPMTSGGGGAVTTTGAGNVTGQVVGTNNPSQPFQNISSYLAANAPQSTTLANQVASSVSDSIQRARGDITTAGQDFTNSVNQGYTPEDTNLIGRVNTNLVDVASNPNDVAAFQRQLNDTYTGPFDFTSTPGYSNLEAEIANAQGRAANAQTPEGVQSLLRDVEGPVTAGVNKLDSLLLNQNPVNARTIQDAGQGGEALPGILSTQTTGANDRVQQAIAAARTARDSASGVASTQQQTLASGLLDELTRAQGQAQGFNSELNDIVQRSATGQDLTPDEIRDLAAEGIDNPNALSGYYSPSLPVSLPTNSNVITPEQWAVAQALNKLVGFDVSGLMPGERFSLPQMFTRNGKTFVPPATVKLAGDVTPGTVQNMPPPGYKHGI